MFFNIGTSEINKAISRDKGLDAKYLDDNCDLFNVGISNLIVMMSISSKVLGISLNCKYIPYGSNNSY